MAAHTLPGLLYNDTDAPAILAPGCDPLSFRDLSRRVWGIGHALRSAGVGRTDRVAVVLPNGPEMAVAFLGIACSAICSPLNPGYRTSEFDFCFDTLRPKLLVLPDASDSPARAAAVRLGIPVLEFSAVSATSACSPADLPEPGDLALVLQTSGTTARPKIVPFTHSNLCVFARNIANVLELTPGDRCLNVMPLFHMQGLGAALLASLAAGASVVCAPGFLATEFFSWLDRFRPTWYTAVPTIHQSVLARVAENRAILDRCRLRFVRSSSAPLAAAVFAEMESVFRAPVIEAYGTTETCQLTCNRLPPGLRKPGTVGVAIGCEIGILDDAGVVHRASDAPTPEGRIVMRGDNIAGGYEGDPEAYREAFHDGWFRTGDVGSLDADGYLTLTARTREVINRGGEKISPREIDDVLLGHPAVAQALAFALPDSLLGEDVAAAVVLRPGCISSAIELREFAARVLADFKVPRRIVFLDEIPKGPTGKPQRIGLAARLGIVAEVRRGRAPFVAPRTPTATAVAAIWERVLRVPNIGEDDDFFACGGDSLLAAVFVSRLSDAVGKRLPIFSVFAYPVLGEFAAYCDRTADLLSWAPLTVADRSTGLRASYAQERMWFLLQYEPAAQPYTAVVMLRLSGDLNRDALRRSLAALVRRHEVLRTVYYLSGSCVMQRILDDPALPLRVEDRPAATIAEIHDLALAERTRPFDLSSELPFRAVLAVVSPGESYLVLSIQHIAFDAWSKNVLLTGLAAFYRHFAAGQPLVLEPLVFQYADYAAWERSFLARDVFPGQIAYWRRALHGAPPFLPLPADRPRLPRQSFHGGGARLDVPHALLAEFRELCRACQATLYMGLLAVLDVLLVRYSGSTDIVVGSPVANRDLVQTEPLIGVFINTLAIRADLSGEPCFTALLERVREAALAAFENRQVAFAAVVEALAPARSTAHSPFYQVLFQLRRPAAGRHVAAGVDIAEVEPRHSVAPFDLSLDAIETDEGLRLELIFNSDLFEPSTAERLLRHFSNLLREVCLDSARPISQLPLLDTAERARLLAASHASSEPMPPDDFPRMFEAVAEALPDRLAASFAGSEWSYRHLNASANRIAHGLRERGIGPGDVVGVALERSLELLAALLGVLKSGAAFLPLDPHLPPARLEFLIDDSRASLILGSLAGAVPLAAVESTERGNPARPPAAGGTAYLLYTSGSTGEPKGVAVPHRALANLLVSMARTIGFTSADSWLATTTISFDISIAELFLPLTLGGSVEIAPDGVSGDGQRLAQFLDASGCTFWQATPSAWRILLAAGWTGSPRLRGICGGEELPLDLARRIRPLVGRLWNFYGPTETTIWSMAAEVPPDPQRITLGRPLANTRVYVLDGSLEPQPPGVLGELYIAGAGVAEGYAGRPELSAARFLADPFVPGGRMFRTGDLARLLADGSIEFCGRADAQVKFRGFRIELEEVEKAVARHPDVAAAVVVLHSEGDAPLLVCYYVVRGAEPSAAELRVFLQRWLPDYMLPSRFVAVPDFPRTANGKLDRKSLATQPPAALPLQPHRPAADAVEERIAALCAELLQIERVAVDADLFDLGAHSLLCAALLERIHREFGCRVPLPLLFEAPTVESLAAIVTGRHAVEPAPRIVAVRPSGGRTPLFWVKADPMLRSLAQRLPDDQPIFGLFLPENDPLPRPYRIADIAAFHLETLRRQRPRGPYRLGGFCAAGLVAFEMARRLEAAGEDVSALILIDTRNPRASRKSGLIDVVRDHAAQFAEKGPLTYTRDKLLAVDSWVERRRLESRLQRGGTHRSAALEEERNPEFVELRSAASRYVPGPYQGPALLVRRPIRGRTSHDLGWGHLIPRLTISELPASHLGFFSEPHVSRLAALVSAHLREAEGQP